MSFIGELRRRNVVRVAIGYAVGSWLILQLADVFGSLPDWTGKLVVLLVVLGLPVAPSMSWLYEITPEGIKRTSAVDAERPVPQTGRRLDRLMVVGLALAIIAVLADRYVPRDAVEPQSAASPGESATALQPRSIAVLPFVNMSNDQTNEYFSDGISEEILNTLARVEGLQVAARTAAVSAKKKCAALFGNAPYTHAASLVLDGITDRWSTTCDAQSPVMSRTAI